MTARRDRLVVQRLARRCGWLGRAARCLRRAGERAFDEFRWIAHQLTGGAS